MITALRGYCDCACRDCFEIAFYTDDSENKPGFCHACKEAGCPDYQGQPGMSQECQREDAYREDAYGCDSEEV